MKPVELSWEDYRTVSDTMAWARGVCAFYGKEAHAATARDAERRLTVAIDLLRGLMFAKFEATI